MVEMHDEQLLRRGLLERVALQLQQMAGAIYVRAPWGFKARQAVECIYRFHFRCLLARRGAETLCLGPLERDVLRAGGGGEGFLPTQQHVRELSSQCAHQ